jgi:hypothetical protein
MCTGKPLVGGIISKQDLQDLEEFLTGSFTNDHPIFHTPPASPCMDRGSLSLGIHPLASVVKKMMLTI